jgi:type I restriction enzyme S subunit
MSMVLKPYPEYKDSGLPWLGEIPKHWSSISVKRHFSIQLGKMLQGTQAKADERPVYYLKAQHVQWFAVRTLELPTMWASPKEVVQFGVQPGDLLVCEGGEGGRCGIVKQLPDQCIIQNALHRVRPAGTSHVEYLQYVMSAVAATGWFTAINNKATIAHFTREKFGALGIPVPPSHEQDAITAFLAHVDRCINRLIRAKRRLIELLNEQEHTIIQQAVTRGLDPTVRLKPSGIDWLGDVPEHWEVGALRRFWKVVDCKHLTVPFVEDGIPLASVVEVQSFDLDLTHCKRTTEEWYQHLVGGGRKPKRGDLIYCRNASVGACAYVNTDIDFAMGQDVCLITSRIQSQRYLNYLLHSWFMAEQLERLLVGSTFKRINISNIRALVVLVPPRSEQDAICRELDNGVAEITSAIKRAYREIDLLREYRTRLTADVVTGKLDVRGVELLALDEAEASEAWETDEDAQADEVEEMEGVDA